MIKKLKKRWYLALAAILTPAALLSAEKAVSHLLLAYASKTAAKTGKFDEAKDD